VGLGRGVPLPNEAGVVFSFQENYLIIELKNGEIWDCILGAIFHSPAARLRAKWLNWRYSGLLFIISHYVLLSGHFVGDTGDGRPMADVTNFRDIVAKSRVVKNKGGGQAYSS